MLAPGPVIVDADVLIRNVDYVVRRGYSPALLGHASRNYSSPSAVALFAATQVRDEAIRHLPAIAGRRGVDFDAVQTVWNEQVVPKIRFVDVPDSSDDPRVLKVESLHRPDRATAALTSLLAPAVLATDNRRHFRPFGLPDEKTDKLAVDLFILGQAGLNVNGALLIPRATISLAVAGTRQLLAKVSSEAAVAIGFASLASVAVFLTSRPGQVLRSRVADGAQRVGFYLSQIAEEGVAASERVSAFAVAAPEHRGAQAIIARRLATDQPLMATAQVAEILRDEGFVFKGLVRHSTMTRARLVSESCFEEVSRGYWALGSYSAELRL
jgi:hypothetical protein